MKFTLLYKLMFFVLLSVFVANACSTINTDETDETDGLKDEDSIIVDYSSALPLVYTKYKIPLPVNIYMFLLSHNFDFNRNILLRYNKTSGYSTNVYRAFNFGIYASDLAYCTIFKQNQESLIYFHTTKKLADVLNVGRGYNRQIIKRLTNNLHNQDSLISIAANAYNNACLYLEDIDDVNILPFIVTGAWLESIYLLMHLPNDDIAQNFLDKRRTSIEQSLDNILKYLFDVMVDSNAFVVNEEVQDLHQKLSNLKQQFNESEDFAKAYPQIKKTIVEIRNSYTQ